LQIHIHIETQGEVSITAKLNSSGDFETKSDNSDDFSYSFKVQYLPPILLTCLLPKSYPSHLPPYFTLSVQWLDSSRISNLCSMLDTIWREQPGQEVMYQWVEWLQISSLSHLGFDKAIMLGPYGIRHAGDRRAVSGIFSPDVDIPTIKSYNDERHHENFLKNLHECCICFSEYAGNCQPLLDVSFIEFYFQNTLVAWDCCPKLLLTWTMSTKLDQPDSPHP
jgi:E3 ubiquitin-protein ligase RNF14